jgi:hypothetical protein
MRIPLTFTKEGLTNKQVFEGMARAFREQRSDFNYGGYEFKNVVVISSDLADQLAEFCEDIAKAIDG